MTAGQVLTTGPVGFGDSLPRPGFSGTNVTRLRLASRWPNQLSKVTATVFRLDGVILKPAAPVLRLDRTTAGGPELWAAACLPARADKANDSRAESLARLDSLDGTPDRADSRWWFALLATDTQRHESREIDWGCSSILS